MELPAGSEKIDSCLLTGGPAVNYDSLMQATYTNLIFFRAKYEPLFAQLLALPGD